MHECMCVCIQSHKHTCVYTFVYSYIHIHALIYICFTAMYSMYIYLYNMHMQKKTCTQKSHTHTPLYIYICLHTYSSHVFSLPGFMCWSTLARPICEPVEELPVLTRDPPKVTSMHSQANRSSISYSTSDQVIEQLASCRNANAPSMGYSLILILQHPSFIF